MSTIKNEMLSVEDVSTALKISKSQVYKVLKKNKNIIKPMIKVDGKTYISHDGIKYIEDVFNKTITSISLNGHSNISLEEVAVTSNVTKSFKNKNLEELKLENLIEKDTIPATKTTIKKDNLEKSLSTISKNENNITKVNFKKEEEIYVTPIKFEGKTVFKDEIIHDSKENIKILTEEERLKLEEEKRLEKHCKEIDSKLINLKEKLIEKQELNKKGFFRKVLGNIFNK